MKSRILFFSGILLCAPTFVYGACSVANLTKCLDSACAINLGSNPSARYQLCGYGEISGKSNSMKSVSIGASSKYTISDKELKSAPKNAGERYIWATKLCLEKLPDCTSEDVDDNYDKLIIQSCKAANVSANMSDLTKKANVAKTQTDCTDEIGICITDDKRCMSGYANCKSDADFTKHFADCSVLSTGCESFLTDIKASLESSRKIMLANAEKFLQSIVNQHKSDRDSDLNSAQNDCANNIEKQKCIEQACMDHLPNKCGLELKAREITQNETRNEIIKMESSIAEQLCQYYDTACQRLK